MPLQTPSHTTLHGILARFNFLTTLLAVTLAWLAIVLAGMTALKSYATQNLEMAAELASYGAEPGLVFQDSEAAREGVMPLIEKNGIARLRVTMMNGSPLVDEYSQTPDPSPMLTSFFMPDPTTVTINHNGMDIGRVDVWGDSSELITFARLGLLAGLGCLGITVAGTLFLRRRFERELARPLRAIASVAHDVRLHRRFDRRVAPVGVMELDQLGGDINALLDELQGWQGHMEHENAALMHRANHDPLTSLPNRAAFDQELQRRIDEAEAAGTRFALIFIDADNFKQANDHYGHAAGDQVLMVLAKRMMKIMGERDFVARLGGDEFVVILDPLDSEQKSSEFVARLQACVTVPINFAEQGQYSASISVGVANFPENGGTAAELLTAADAAMYADKFSQRAILGTRR